MRILLAEDDSVLADGLTRSLRQSGYAIDYVKNGQEADTALSTQEFDLLILDLGLPKMSGLEVLRRLRARASLLPVLILTAADSIEQRVNGLDLGADDYMAKPFALSELEARVRALTRRGAGGGATIIKHGPLSYDQVGRSAYINDQMLDLSARELGLLEILLGRTGRLVSKEQLVDHLCEWGEEVSNNAIEVYVHRLRKKIEVGGVRIATVRGLGYCLEKYSEARLHAEGGRLRCSRQQVKGREAPPDEAVDDDWFEPPTTEQDDTIEHSLFGEILDWMLAPLLLLWPMSIAITYLVAKSIANQPFDHALEDSVTVLTQQVKQADGEMLRRVPDKHSSKQGRDFLRGDDVDTLYYLVVGARGEYLDGDRDLPPPQDPDKYRSGTVLFRNDTIHGAPVRVAFTYLDMPSSTEDEPRRALVQVAETLEKRAQLANEIIKGVILPQFIILPVILALVWFALARGLSPLAQLQERIRARPPDDLSPIESGQVPEEITPLVGSLNEMLARLSLSIDMQKRFIADAAHQMKTPLAGMRMQSELALRQTDHDEIHRSLLQLAKSSEAATRLVNQLLALARAENQPQAGTAFEPIELGELARGAVQDWVQASFAQHIDLGFEQSPYPIMISGNAIMLRELLSNLIDNALRYTPSGGSVTVRVRSTPELAILEVEDTGPGIPQTERAHVFERFYRILGSNAEGSGLGLAIVREIAQQHGAEVDIFNNPRATSPKLPGTLLRLSIALLLPDAPEEDDITYG